MTIVYRDIWSLGAWMFGITMPLFFLGSALGWSDQTLGWAVAGAVGLVTSVWTYFRFSSEPPR
jgi:hypothetical protein